ncbi:MAG: hypothetical protein HYX48_04125 [Chlamydiales bacterium]|nr:hypothetical protein [Chlamydiales bacterium]
MVISLSLRDLRNFNLQSFIEAKDENANLMPLTYIALDKVTEFMSPKVAVAEDSGYVKKDVEMECLESMGRRVFGALSYAGLLGALFVEEFARLCFFSIMTCMATAYHYCLDERDFITWNNSQGEVFATQVFASCIYLVDGPVRIVSALVQKCLLDAKNEDGTRKDLDDVALIHWS